MNNMNEQSYGVSLIEFHTPFNSFDCCIVIYDFTIIIFILLAYIPKGLTKFALHLLSYMNIINLFTDILQHIDRYKDTSHTRFKR